MKKKIPFILPNNDVYFRGIPVLWFYVHSRCNNGLHKITCVVEENDVFLLFYNHKNVIRACDDAGVLYPEHFETFRF